MVAPKKERHHFLPVFYLEGFVDPENEPHLWVYDKEGGDVRPVSPRDAGVEKHGYSIPRADGRRDSTTVENALATIEGQVAPMWAKLRRLEALTNAERSMISLFLALMITRVPAYRRNIESSTAAILKKLQQKRASRPDFEAQLAARHRKKTGQEPDPELLRRFCEAMARGDFDVDVYPVYSLAKIPLAGDFAKIIHQMEWAFVRPDSPHRFVTGDNPLVYVMPGRDRGSGELVALRDRDVELTCAISRDLALVARWGEIEDGAVATIPERAVNELDLRTIWAAQRFVYASQRSDELNAVVQRYRGSGPKIIVR